ncbi:DIMBOA UDP-glucosyltransferase BX8-like [Hordeum vulgare subsp. vulgare]|uniref:DIMBOA UDP-glucosyltransferase BX8-like n=1 Tax=Hordeum vulgare subsp. vulgare TaxID=112509 RepID=UPI001D1A50AA|nr:DIMBOA UDP-glucosyltransferase BX8-like [Hordeum vulgare subsp. vulgare]
MDEMARVMSILMDRGSGVQTGKKECHFFYLIHTLPFERSGHGGARQRADSKGRRRTVPDPSRHPAYDFVPVPDGLPAGTPETVTDIMEHIFAVNSSCEAPFRERLAAQLEAPGARDQVACLAADAHLLALVRVARRLGVPTLVPCTDSVACFRNFVANPVLCHKGYLPVGAESQLDALVRELPSYRVRDLMGANSSSRHEHELMCKLLSRAVEAMRSSAGFAFNPFDALEGDDLAASRRDLAGVPVFVAGPLHKLSPASSSSLLQQDRSCLDWLDAQAPTSLLYISFGSLASMSGADLDPCYAAFWCRQMSAAVSILLLDIWSMMGL